MWYTNKTKQNNVNLKFVTHKHTHFLFENIFFFLKKFFIYFIFFTPILYTFLLFCYTLHTPAFPYFTLLNIHLSNFNGNKNKIRFFFLLFIYYLMCRRWRYLSGSRNIMWPWKVYSRIAKVWRHNWL